jgi:hypothetical protein
MTLEIEGLRTDPRFRRTVARKLTATVEKVAVPPTAARVDFTDENGPKGGIHIRCGITLDLPRRPAVHVGHLAPTPVLAFAGALDSLELALARRRARERAMARRPKKYFAARRLVEDAVPSAPRPRRARRRKAA